MSITESLILFGIMSTLAAMPSTSVALVITRSATLGVRNGIAVAIGIVMGDLCFVTTAIFGLTAIAKTMADLFTAIKYLGAIYLLWLGISLLTASHKTKTPAKVMPGNRTLIASFLAGIALTLGDLKAIFFYLSLFPKFIGAETRQPADILMIFLITITSVGGVKIAYALLAARLSSMATGLNVEPILQKIAGALMLGTGLYILAHP